MNPSSAQNPSLVPLHLARRALRYYKSALVVFVIGGAATAAVVHRTQNVFRSETVVLYRQARPEGSSGVEPARRVLSRLSDTLLARDRLSKIVSEFRLYPDAKTPEAAVEVMKSNVGFRAREGSTFVISFDGRSPGETQRVTQRLTQSLIDDTSSQRREEAEETKRFLDGEQRRLQEESRKREAETMEFLKRHPELGAPATAMEGSPAGNPTELFNLEMALVRLKEQPASPTSPTPSAPSPIPGRRLPPEQLQALRRAEAELTAAQTELANRKQFMTEANPDVLAAQGMVKNVEARVNRLREEAAKAEAAPEPPTGTERTPVRPTPTPSAAPTEDSQVALLERRITELRRSMSASGGRRGPRPVSPQVDLQFQALRRALEDLRGRLSQVEERRFQASLAAKFEATGSGGQLVIIDPANLPGIPSVNVRKKMAAVGAAATMMLMLLVALLRALSDDRLFDKGDVQWMVGLPVLASVPRQLK